MRYQGDVESIKRARRTRGMSLSEVAAASGLTRESIARAERDGTDPRGSTIQAIARALRVPVCKLFGENHRGKTS